MSGLSEDAPPSFDALKIIDVDTHLSEASDLWTSRAPARIRDLVPHVVSRVDGESVWLFDGDRLLSEPAGSANSVRRDGTKKSLWEYTTEKSMGPDESLEAAHDPKARLEMMNDEGIWAQVVYPNLLIFSMGVLARSPNRSLANAIVSIYNDAMAEIQSQSDGRLVPMAAIPFWDVEAAVLEVERAASTLGLRGITLCSEPHATGFGDLGNAEWDPLWKACTDLGVPINLHAGSSEFGMETYSKQVWPSLSAYRKHLVGAMNVELHQIQILTNLLTCGVLERHPTSKWVMVESGLGWIPYVLERLEFQMRESVPASGRSAGVSPIELFRRQVYSTFWFEEIGPARVLDFLGFENIMFETDFPHPVCRYPSAAGSGLAMLEPWGAEVQRAIMQDNAANLYGIPV